MPAQAQTVEPVIPVQEIIDNRKDIVQTFPNGTVLVSHKFFTPEILDYVDYQGKPVYKKFKYNEDVNHISFESAAITFTYDKSTCGIKVFEKGRLKQNSQPVLDWVGVSLKEAAINSTDWIDSAVNFVQCQTTPIQVTENGIEFSAIKQNTDGVFETRYVADYGNGLEDFYIYNNTAGVDKQFGYTTVVNNKLNLKIGGAMINRQYIMDTITLNTTEQVKLENGLVIDKMNEPMFLLQRHKPTQDVYDFTKGKHLKKNEVLVVDPKITYNSGITDFVVPSGITNMTVKAWGAGGMCGTGIYSGATPTLGYGGGFARGTLSVSSGQTYKVVLGAGGGSGGSSGGYGTGSGGSGGGYSGVFLTSVSQANAKVIAGGGGGGGGSTCQYCGGGDSSAADGNYSPLQGGNGGNGYPGAGGGGGGGGGGYVGGSGGSGAGGPSSSGYGQRGGRGSNYATGTNTYTEFGTVSNAAAQSDPDYITGVGKGCSNQGSNGQGLVVIIYSLPPPNPPSNFTADSQGRNVQYSWIPSSGSSEVTGYYISRSLANSTWVNATLTGNVTSYLDTAYYRAGLLYYARINAIANGNIGPNAYTSFVMDNVPSAPQNPYAAGTSASTIKINWSTPATNGGDPVTGYRIEYCVTCTSWNLLVNKTNTLNYNHTGLSAGTTVKYRMAAWNNVGVSSYTANFTGQTYTHTAGTATISTQVVGDVIQLNSTVSITSGSPPPEILQSKLYVNNILVKTRSENSVVSVGNPVTLSPMWYQFTEAGPKTFHLRFIVSDSIDGNVTLASNVTASKEYTPRYYTALTPSLGLVNDTNSRNANADTLTVKVNRDKGGNVFDVKCRYKTTYEVLTNAPGRWYNISSAGYYRANLNVSPLDNIYYDCFNGDEPLLAGKSYGNATANPLIVGISLFDSMGGLMGAPSVMLLVIAIFSLATGKNSPQVLVLAMIVLGVLSALGLLVFSSQYWGLLMVAAAIGLFAMKRYYF
ncbi:MAG: fibronectin type III domain-containing protein [Nitrososphaera sp.]